MSKIAVDYDTHTDITQVADPNDRWDMDDVKYHHTIHGIEFSNEFFDLTTAYEVVPGETYILQYVIYDTGDSFHREEGVITFIDLFQKDQLDLVEANEERIWLSTGHSISLLHHTGKEYTTHAEWKGFFENLQDVISTPVQITELK